MTDDPTPIQASSVHFDTALIAEHRRVLGLDASRRIVEMFRTSLAERRVALRSCLDAGDLDGVRRVGHAIKGLAASSGASLLAAAGESIQHADGVSLDEMRVLVERLDVVAQVADAEVASAWQV